MSADYSIINRNSIVCDSSSLISLAEGCMLDIIMYLNRYLRGKFIYPSEVRYESITHPMDMKAHALRALKLYEYEQTRKIYKVEMNVHKEAEELMNLANSIFSINGKNIHLVDIGEAAQIVLAKKLDINILLIDERTTRVLIEAPYKLKSHLSHEFKNKPIKINERLLDQFTEYTDGMRVIRSVELAVIAYKYGYFDKYGEHKLKALESALYTLKFSGCSVSFEEIDELIKEIK